MRTKIYTFIFLYLMSYPLESQLLLRVISVPGETPASDGIYLAGNFQEWQPGSDDWQLEKIRNGHYHIEFSPEPGMIEYKITRGNWSKAETDKEGGSMKNRIYNYKGGHDTLSIIIQAWEDMTKVNSTAEKNVIIWNKNFHMPELDRNRRIWIYVPPDYADSKKNYPVLYMHDGQNVFDASTSYAGEWEVDETLNELFNEGDYGCIVVAIDNGQDERLNEYSPWVNEKYGGGLGKKYIQFIVNTLKPEIDSLFRTKSERDYTAIMGSSMGGLISLYAALEYPEVFSKVGSFSPAYWFSEESFDQAAGSLPDLDIKVYTIAGEHEGNLFLQNVEKMEQALLSAGFKGSDLKLTFHQDGKHSEWYWAREFREAYLWLFTEN